MLHRFRRRLQLRFKPHPNRRSTWKIMGFQNCENRNLGDFETKWHLGATPCLSTENTIRGKVVGSPKSGPWWTLWICVCLWFVCAPKMLQLCTNQLVVWFVQVHVNNWFVHNSSSPHFGALTHPSTLKVLWAKKLAPTLFFSIVFILGLTFKSFK
jgi:hypothetical protein